MKKLILFILLILTSCLYAQDGLKAAKLKKWTVGIQTSYENHPDKSAHNSDYLYDFKYRNYGYGFGINVEKVIKQFKHTPLCLSIKIAPSWNYRKVYYEYFIDATKMYGYYESLELSGINWPLLCFTNYQYKKINVGVGLGINRFYKTLLKRTHYASGESAIFISKREERERRFPFYTRRQFVNYSNAVLIACNLKYLLSSRIQIEYRVTNNNFYNTYPSLVGEVFFSEGFVNAIFTHQLSLNLKF